jgi:hypothetical protein
MDRTDDSTYIDQSPNQAANAFITQQNLEKDDLFTVHGSTETLFDKKVTFSSGFSVTTIDTNLGGSRIYGPAYNAPLSPTFVNNGSGFIGLGGFGNTKEYVGNMNLMLTPIPNLVFVPAARVEYEGSNLSDSFSNTSGVGGGFTVNPEAANTDNWYLDVAQSLEARYTGFRDWSLYASAEYRKTGATRPGTQTRFLIRLISTRIGNGSGRNTPSAPTGIRSPTELRQPILPRNPRLHLHQQSELLAGPVSGLFAKQNFTTDDMNIRATWQALSTVSLVTRYDFQYSTVDTWSIPNGGTQAGGIESANLVNHIIGEDVNWTPLPCLYFRSAAATCSTA